MNIIWTSIEEILTSTERRVYKSEEWREMRPRVIEEKDRIFMLDVGYIPIKSLITPIVKLETELETFKRDLSLNK